MNAIAIIERQKTNTTTGGLEDRNDWMLLRGLYTILRIYTVVVGNWKIWSLALHNIKPFHIISSCC